MSSYNPDNLKSELFDFGTGEWKTVDDYPFTSSRVTSYVMIYIPETLSYLVIGGSDGGTEIVVLSQIARFKGGKWSDAGRLNFARRVSFFFN